ncbi:Maf family protein [Agromyces sp. NPDC058126]|uniref:Maf family protein n=1 Tax=Agromyces sp. NPDC058126 TaxID=3346350 RepID=UPI0036DF9892
MRLYLASTSPARLQTLRTAGIEPIAVPPGVDEAAAVAAHEAESGPLEAPEMVQLLARAKAEALIGARPGGEEIDGLILGGDSAFLTGGAIHGKPHTPDVAKTRWLAQNGGHGDLWSGHWLIDHRGGEVRGAVGRADMATVRFAALDETEIDAYIATGEPLLVAGAFTVDSLGGPFIRRVEGDPSTVVGLSLSTLRDLVRELGVDWTSLWNRGGAAAG